MERSRDLILIWIVYKRQDYFIQQRCKVDFSEKGRFSTLFLTIYYVLRLNITFNGYWLIFNIDVNHRIEKCPFFRY
jgi:hypothetical protein